MLQWIRVEATKTEFNVVIGRSYNVMIKDMHLWQWDEKKMTSTLNLSKLWNRIILKRENMSVNLNCMDNFWRIIHKYLMWFVVFIIITYITYYSIILLHMPLILKRRILFQMNFNMLHSKSIYVKIYELRTYKIPRLIVPYITWITLVRHISQNLNKLS